MMKLFNLFASSKKQEKPDIPAAESHDDTTTSASVYGTSPAAAAATSSTPTRPMDPREQRAHETLTRIQYWMDNSIPLPFTNGKRRIGLDPILGLIPLVGDFGSAMVSLAFVARAAPTLSRYTVTRMLANVWIDSVFGAIPLVGDIFDVAHKANQKNLKLFEQHMASGAELQDRVDRKWLIRISIIFFIFCALTTMAILVLFVLLVLYLTGHL